MSETAIPTIVLFGTTGSGKSSVVNMLPDAPGSPGEKALVKSSLKGVTAEIQPYLKQIEGKTYRVLDTIGTGEGLNGTVPTHKAIERLYDYLLSQVAGVHLIAVVMKCGRITKTEESNYLFARLLFGDAVPVVVIITHLENEPERDKWWDLQDKGSLSPAKAVGIVSSMGNKDRLREEYEASTAELVAFIRTCTIRGPGCQLQPRDWFRAFIERLGSLMRLSNGQFYDEMYKSLLNYEIEVVAAVRLAGKMRPKDPYPVVVLSDNPSANFDNYTKATSSGSLAGVREFRKAIQHLQIRILDIPGVDHVPPITSSQTPSIGSGRAIKTLFNTLIGQPLGVHCVVLVVNGPTRDKLSDADANHYDLMRYVCGPKLPISLLSIIPREPPSGKSGAISLPKRLGAYTFQHHVEIPLNLTGKAQQESTHPARVQLQNTLVEILNSSTRTKTAAYQHQVDRLVASVDEIQSRSSDEFHKELRSVLGKPESAREGTMNTMASSQSIFGRMFSSIFSWWH